MKGCAFILCYDCREPFDSNEAWTIILCYEELEVKAYICPECYSIEKANNDLKEMEKDL